MTKNLSPKGYRSRESFESCSSQSDLFYMIRNPNAPSRPSQPFQVEPELSIQKQIEKDVEEKLKSEEQKVASIVLKIAINLSRWFFMGLVLPPYLIIYSVPKYIFLTAIPIIFHFITYPIVKTYHVTMEKYDKLKNRVKRAATFFQRKKREERVSEEASVFIGVFRSIRDIYLTCMNTITCPFRFVKRKFDEAMLLFREKINALQSFVKSIPRRIVERVKLFICKLLQKINLFLFRVFIHPLIKVFSPKLSIIKDFFSEKKRVISEKILDIHHLVIDFFKNPLQYLLSSYHCVRQKTIVLVLRMSAPVFEAIKRLKEGWKSLMTGLKNPRDTLTLQKCSLVKRNLIGWFHANLSKIHVRTIAFRAMMMHKPKKLLSEASDVLSFRAGKIKHYSLSSVDHINTSVTSQWVKGGNWFKVKMKKASQYIRNVCNYCLLVPLSFLKMRAANTTSIRKKISSLVKSNGDKFTLNLRHTLAWSKVLCCYGMELVRETSQEIMFAIFGRK